MSNAKGRLEKLEKEAEKQDPEEPYTVEYEDDGHVMICRRGDKVVARLHVGNVDLREAI